MFDTILALWDKYYYVYLWGLWGTIWLSAASVAAASVVGTGLAFLRLSGIWAFDLLVRAYLGVLRGTPILLQLYFFWIFLPRISPIELSDTMCILTALIVNAAAYVSEVVRAGIQAVDIGQTEAARSLGMRPHNIMFRIVLPQAVKNILPALGNEYITMIKQTSLASVFFVPELMTSYRTVQSATFLALPSLIIAGLIYLVLTTILTKALDVFERRLKKSER